MSVRLSLVVVVVLRVVVVGPTAGRGPPPFEPRVRG